MIKITRFFYLISMTVLLASCASVQQPTPAPATTTTAAAAPPAPQVLSWPQRYAQLSNIESWNLNGSVSLHHQDKTDMASVNWTQQQSSVYDIALYGPLSLGKISIIGQPNQVTLEQSGHPPVSAKNGETLMQQQLGWHLPVSNLYYWVRGIAAPGATADFKFDKSNRIVQMTQNGWMLQYLNYTTVNNVDLPQRITLSNPNLQATLVVRNWSFQTPMQTAMK
jgi:outer membrane lipoprotein LolB